MSAAANVFDLLFLIARPASGKSEVIHHLKTTPADERMQKFHVGPFEEFDDFVYVWSMFDDDRILEKLGMERVWTDNKFYFKSHDIWNLMVEKLNVHVKRRAEENPELMNGTTAVVEFARGGDNAFAEAFSHVDKDLLERSAVLYIDVSYEESVRKNRKRARQGQEHSILHHSLPDEKMEFYYKTNDWAELSSKSDTHLNLNGVQVPYATFPNEPDVTHDRQLLDDALSKALGKLWTLYSNK